MYQSSLKVTAAPGGDPGDDGDDESDDPPDPDPCKDNLHPRHSNNGNRNCSQ